MVRWVQEVVTIIEEVAWQLVENIFKGSTGVGLLEEGRSRLRRRIHGSAKASVGGRP